VQYNLGAFLFGIIVPGQLNFFYLVLQSFLSYNKIVATNKTIEEEEMTENRYELNKNLAQMLKGGVIMDVQNPEQARIAEAAGAAAVWLWKESRLIFVQRVVYLA
jgi:pyridoxal 5'-phosphate synthase pdxS subunit